MGVVVMILTGCPAHINPVAAPSTNSIHFPDPNMTNDERVALLLTSARETQAQGKDDLALEQLFAAFQLSDRPAERLYIKQRMQTILSHFPVEKLTLLTRTFPDSAIHALAGVRLIEIARAENRRHEAKAFRNEIASLCETFDIALPETDSVSESSTEPRLLLLLPFQGKYHALGTLGLKGAMAHLQLSTPAQRHASMIVRDSATPQLEDWLPKLIFDEQIRVVVGSVDPQEAKKISEITSRFSIPLISLSVPQIASSPASMSSASVLSILPSNSQRAKALAEVAIAHSHSPIRFVTLAPETPLGREMVATFSEALQSHQGILVTSIFYSPEQRTFEAEAKTLANHEFDLVFIPDTARAVRLIAPALALAGRWPVAPQQTPPKGKGIQLVATADGLSQHLVTLAGRYLQGAIFAPGFFIDDTLVTTAPAWNSFFAQHRRLPALFEAFAHDAVQLAIAMLMSATFQGTSLPSPTKLEPISGLTGTVRFNAQGYRSDSPLLYRLVDNRILTVTVSR